MINDVHPASDFFHAALIAAVAAALWGPVDTPIPQSSLALDYLLWPVAAAAALAFLVDLAFALQRTRLGPALRLPPKFRPLTALGLWMFRRLLRGGAWSALAVGALAVLADTQAEPRAYDSFIVGAGVALAVLVALRTAGIPFPVEDIFPFPRWRLVGLGVIYLLARQQPLTVYGFAGSPLLPTLTAAVVVSWLGDALRNTVGLSAGHNGAGARPGRWLSGERSAFCQTSTR